MTLQKSELILYDSVWSCDHGKYMLLHMCCVLCTLSMCIQKAWKITLLWKAFNKRQIWPFVKSFGSEYSSVYHSLATQKFLSKIFGKFKSLLKTNFRYKKSIWLDLWIIQKFWNFRNFWNTLTWEGVQSNSDIFADIAYSHRAGPEGTSSQCVWMEQFLGFWLVKG